ncbi:MAG TPA: AbrB/MazE/SpoVT family DNA-binding domain-containing protein [Pyrinomonadaceae bacterium]|nr:AbrB/MazE/SpoVT family DNA-binding domain-containing protein [Pyrinomonadaceae bacterium]
MELEMRENGEVFLPVSLLLRIGINIGDTLQLQIKDGDLVLSPKQDLEYDPSDDTSGSPPYEGGVDAASADGVVL